MSRDEAERLKFWSGRKNAFPASGRISPDYMCMDSTIPRKRLADILLAIQEMEKKYGLRCANVFHAGDGNLHPLILFDANDADQLHRCELFGAEILETSVAMGGTVTGEHGVGVEKLNSMCVQFTPGELEQMLGVKRAFDPEGLLNPGKVIPTLQSLRRVRQDAGARRAHRAPRPAALLGPRRHGCRNRQGPRSIRPTASDMRVFISIASYCDPILGFTLARAVATARWPDQLHFGVVDQSPAGSPHPAAGDVGTGAPQLRPHRAALCARPVLGPRPGHVAVRRRGMVLPDRFAHGLRPALGRAT